MDKGDGYACIYAWLIEPAPWLHNGAFAAPVCRGSTSAAITEGHVDLSLPFCRDSQKYPLKSESSLQDLSLNRHKRHLEG